MGTAKPSKDASLGLKAALAKEKLQTEKTQKIIAKATEADAKKKANASVAKQIHDKAAIAKAQSSPTAVKAAVKAAKVESAVLGKSKDPIKALVGKKSDPVKAAVKSAKVASALGGAGGKDPIKAAVKSAKVAAALGGAGGKKDSIKEAVKTAKVSAAVGGAGASKNPVKAALK